MWLEVEIVGYIIIPYQLLHLPAVAFDTNLYSSTSNSTRMSFLHNFEDI